MHHPKANFDKKEVSGFHPNARWVWLALLFLFVNIALSGQSFSVSTLSGSSMINPTSLQFGPDQRLYVADQAGFIHIYTITRNGVDDYQVTATETITSIQNIPNHNDDGTFYNVSPKRQITGLLVSGTPSFPILYVTSSDFRIGGGGTASDINLDTNSGIISKLSWNGTAWDMVHLVRGLPRSEENHATNGMFLDESSNTLYVAQGGNTNAGAPSNNFAFLTEFALAACILEVDLTTIESLSVKTDTFSGASYYYDLPTVDDPERSNANGIDDPVAPGYDGVDIHDPFGGNDGLNQAKLIQGEPVQVHTPGFRNPYDILISEAGKMYTWDNGANLGWGGHPDNEGVGTATNNWVPGEPGSDTPGPNDAVINNLDGLHLISGSNYYGGHPTPIRANPSGAGLFTHNDLISGGENGQWRQTYNAMFPDSSLPYDWPPVPISMANPVEGDFQNPGVDNLALYTHEESTNGLVEYTASNFSNAMKGDLLAVSFAGKLYRVKLNASGTINSPSDVSVLGTGFGSVPLDVTSTGDGGPFAGSIWVADYVASSIIVFEPQDFQTCTGADDPMIDEDVDGYTNADEIDNGTDPCNGASIPEDFDQTLIGGFKVSNLNDPDDDDDMIPDSIDYFAWDATNGLSLQIPIDYPLLNGDPGIGFYGLGFTGLMSNGSSDYLELWKTEENSNVEIIAGGAVGLLTLNQITDGDALGSLNDQHNGFQFGIDVNEGTAPFTIDAKLLGPPFIGSAEDFQNAGIFIGPGDQDNYIKISYHANNGNPKVRVTEENLGVANSTQYDVTGLAAASEIRFLFDVNPSLGTVQPQYAIGFDPPTQLGSPITLSDTLLSKLKSQEALAIGVIATSRGTDSTFHATWDYIKVDYTPLTVQGQWVITNPATSCQPFGTPGSCSQGRHENGFLEVGDKFYMIGGRENNSNVNIYDPATGIWTVGADAPISIHHFQGVELDGMIWVVGAFTGGFPNEVPLDRIYIYDPFSDTWHDGPIIPASRRRGSGGTIAVDGKIYWAGGIQNGHVSGWVNWLDVFDPSTNTWDTLSPAPRARDHFQLGMLGENLYAVGGRRTNEFGNTFLPYVTEVDIFDLNTETWSTATQNLPTGRAGALVSSLGDEILVIGGEVSTSSFAEDVTEAYQMNSGTWRTLASMNIGRHATQVIKNNGGLYVAGGSPAQGEGMTQVEEAFYLFNQSNPILQSITEGNLAVDVDTIDFGEVNSTDTVFAPITLSNLSADQGVLIHSLTVLNTIDYELTNPPELPFFLRPNQSLVLNIAYHPDGLGSDLSVLNIDHTGITNFSQVHFKANGAEQPAGIFINCGGPSVFTSGIVWDADMYYSSGNTYSDAIEILATDDDTIYQSERNRNGTLNYNIPVDSGWYNVNLHFAEIYNVSNGAGGYILNARRFDVKIEGQLVLDNYNINQENAPEQAASALVESFPVLVEDGTLNISLQKIVNTVKINAISVLPRDCPPPGAACDDQNPYTVNDIADGNCNCAGVIPQYIWLEPECGTVGSKWTIETNMDASNDEAVLPYSQTSIGGPKTTPADLVVIPFYVSDSSNFKIFGRVLTLSSSSDSYWIRVDNSSWKSWNTINSTPYDSTFRWSRVWHYVSGPGIMDVSFNLDVGFHNLIVSYREPNSKLDKFFITNTDSIPVVLGPEGENCSACMTNTYYSNIDTTVCAGDSLFIGGAYQSGPGIFIDTFNAANGCDSIVIATLTVADTHHIFTNYDLCVGDSVYLAGAFQTNTGLYIDTFQTVFGCDSIVETTVTVRQVYADTLELVICENDSVLAGGAFQNSPGYYSDTLNTGFGCDSILVTSLDVLDTSMTILSGTICEGDSMLIFGEYQQVEDLYKLYLTNENDCDSLVLFDLTVIQTIRDTVEVSICFPDSLFAGGAYQKSSGAYIDTLVAMTGCDSIMYTILDVHPTFLDSIVIEICDWDSVFVGGSYQDTSGYYVDSLHSIFACDSVVVTQLIVVDSCVWEGGTIVYVDSSAVGLNDGTSWANAFVDVLDAISLFSYYDNLDQVWVASGTYFASKVNLRSDAVVLFDSIALYGSFAGTETNPDQRDTNQLSTILSGDIGVKGDSTDNSYHLIMIDSSATNVYVDGFVLEKSVANGGVKLDQGGAIYSEGAATFKNVMIREIVALGYGRVVHLNGVKSMTTFEKVIIIDQGPDAIKSINGAGLILKNGNQLKKK